MTDRPGWIAVLLLGILLLSIHGSAQGVLHRPVIDGHWLRPSDRYPAQPMWGHADGLRVGLWPLPGPRGLLRVYAPYLGHEEDRMINYIAVEPIVTGGVWRSFSELEESLLDGVQGLRFWSSDRPDDEDPRDPRRPSRGTVASEGDVETLCVYVFLEPFRSGARVFLQLEFRSDRPHEVGITTFTQDGSARLSTCVITATMGNFARLRTLHLAGGTRSALDMWPGFSGADFAEHICVPLSDLLRTAAGDALFVATPNERSPEDATYAPGTFIGWHYYGDVATQYWRREAPPSGLKGCVNARATYWASNAAIPGGISFENFELIEPFRNGNQAWFGVEPGPYEALVRAQCHRILVTSHADRRMRFGY